MLATQTLTIGAGQNLNLTQAMLPSVLSGDHAQALIGLATGGDVFSVVAPAIPADAGDRKAGNLTLGGLLELQVVPGGSITGDAGAALTVSKLLNEGTIRLPGGSISTLPSAALNGQNLYQFQSQLPSVYAALALDIGSSANGFTTNGFSVIQVGGDFTLKPGSTLISPVRRTRMTNWF